MQFLKRDESMFGVFKGAKCKIRIFRFKFILTIRKYERKLKSKIDFTIDKFLSFGSIFSFTYYVRFKCTRGDIIQFWRSIFN